MPNVDWPMTVAELKSVIGPVAAEELFCLPQRFHQAKVGATMVNDHGKATGTSGNPTIPHQTAFGLQPTEPTRIFARRYSAHGDDDQPWTSFHFDSAHTTVNVALSSDADFEGGKLLGLFGGGVRVVERSEGDATVHTSSLLHGVSRMWEGVRYSLIMFFPGPVGRERSYSASSPLRKQDSS